MHDDKDLKLKSMLTAESGAHVDGKIKFIRNSYSAFDSLIN